MLTSKNSKTNSVARIIRLKTDIHSETKFSRKSVNQILIQKSNKIQLVDIETILFLEADGNYTRLHLSTGECLYCSKPLKSFDIELSQTNRFMRVHQSYLIRADAIECYYHIGHIKLKGLNKNIPVSRRKKTHVLKFFEHLQSRN